MWTSECVLESLMQYRQICAEIQIIENELNVHSIYIIGSTDRVIGHLHELINRRDLVAACLSALTKEEQFILEMHLINGLDWAKVLVEYENEWGTQNTRSERTLKRIQAKAIDRIVNFVNGILRNN